MTATASNTTKQLCRLCYYETNDTINIFAELNKNLDYQNKIKKYLYLQVSDDDDQPNTICWMCTQNIETFHKFYEKINEIQLDTLKENYRSVVLKPIYAIDYVPENAIEKINEIQLDTLKENYRSVVLKPINAIDYVPENAIEITQKQTNSSNFDNNIITKTTTIENKPHETRKLRNRIIQHYKKDNIKCENIEYLPKEIELDTSGDQSHEILIEIIETNQLSEEHCEKIDGIKSNLKSNIVQELLLPDEGNEDVEEKNAVYDENQYEKLNEENENDEFQEVFHEISQRSGSNDSINEYKKTDESTTTTMFENNDMTIVKSEINCENDTTTTTDETNTLKRKRGRPKGTLKNVERKVYSNKKLNNIKSECDDKNSSSTSNNNDNNKIIKKNKGKRLRLNKNRDIPLHEIVGETEYAGRDPDNEDWPAQEILDNFPKKILDDGLLLVKGRELMTMVCKFFKLECDQCPPNKSRFKSIRELFKHYTDMHNVAGYVTCCQTKLSRYPTLIMHMARHLQPEDFKCDTCGYMVTRPRFLKSHKQTHLPEELKPLGCDVCGKRFCWKGALQIHMIQHQPVNERKLYVCHICGKSYETPGGLSTHKKLIHCTKKDTHVCHVCAKKFAARTGLNEHMASIHQPRENGQLKCEECGKWLMNKRCLKSHMVLHSDIVHKCNKCDYSTKKNVLLKRHLLTQHTDKKPYSCEQCDKSFKIKRSLTIHIAQHSATRIYKCNFCIREFNSSTNFYSHRKNMHPLQLQRMREKELELQRQKRIRAGIETMTTNVNSDGENSASEYNSEDAISIIEQDDYEEEEEYDEEEGNSDVFNVEPLDENGTIDDCVTINDYDTEMSARSPSTNNIYHTENTSNDEIVLMDIDDPMKEEEYIIE